MIVQALSTIKKKKPKAAFDFLSWLWNCNQWQYSQDFAQCTDYFFFKIMSSLIPLNALMKAKMISISEKISLQEPKIP